MEHPPPFPPRRAALIRDRVTVRPLGSPELKGKSRAVEVFELLGLVDVQAGAPASA